MSDDIAERLRKRAYRLAAKDFNGGGAKLAMEAADEITRLRAENERLREALSYYAEEDYNGYNGSGACARTALKGE